MVAATGQHTDGPTRLQDERAAALEQVDQSRRLPDFASRVPWVFTRESRCLAFVQATRGPIKQTE